MKTLRFCWWLVAAFLSKHGHLVVVAAIASTLLFALVPTVQRLLPRPTPATTIGLIGRHTITDLPEQVTKKISQGLTKTDNQGAVVPALASDWKISEDGLTYTFTIDTTQSWHDDTQLTSRDVHVPLENVQTELPNDQTIVFRLKEPFSPFPIALSRPLFKSGLIGIGPWRVSSVRQNGEIVERITLTGPENKRVIYRFYLTSQDLMTALKLGEVDQIEDVTNPDDIPKWDQLVIEPQLHPDRYIAVFFNTQDANLSEKSFRQALTYAIPNKTRSNDRALSPVNPNSWAYNPQVKPYETDVAQAKELLASVFKEGSKIPAIELTTFLAYLDRAEEIATAWRDIGVPTAVKVATVTPREFQALLIGQQIPADPDQYVLWHSTQATNLTHYSSPKVDKLLEDGRKTVDQKKRVEIYRDFQRFLLEDSPAAFLEHITTYSVKRK